jgi:hypothetical protein
MAMSKRKVKVEYESPACCNPYMYGMGGYGGFQGGSNYGGMGSIRWIYALLILIVIVLQFGRREVPFVPRTINQCGNEVAATKDGNDEIAIAAIGGGYGGLGFGGYPYNFESIDRSVLFIIVVFLLILCGGCFWGGYGGCAGGYGGGGYGAY